MYALSKTKGNRNGLAIQITGENNIKHEEGETTQSLTCFHEKKLKKTLCIVRFRLRSILVPDQTWQTKRRRNHCQSLDHGMSRIQRPRGSTRWYLIGPATRSGRARTSKTLRPASAPIRRLSLARIGPIRSLLLARSGYAALASIMRSHEIGFCIC